VVSGARIFVGDALDRLQELPDCSVQTCITSPPYWGLRDYGNDGQLGLEPTPDEYVANMVAVFREVRRVLADDGTLWLNLGDSYASGKQLVGIPWRVAFALQADGWWLRQDIIWHKPNPMPESVTDRCTKAHEYLFLLSKSARYYYDATAISEPFLHGHMQDEAKRRKSSTSLRMGDYMVKVAETTAAATRAAWALRQQKKHAIAAACGQSPPSHTPARTLPLCLPTS
jgi:DNA modification methylase